MTTTWLALALTAHLGGIPAVSQYEDSGAMANLMNRFRADEGALGRLYPIEESRLRLGKMDEFYKGWLKALDEVPFGELSGPGKADWIILRHKLRVRMDEESFREAQLASTHDLHPFLDDLSLLIDQRPQRLSPNAEESAEALTKITQLVKEARRNAEKSGAGKIKDSDARRAHATIRRLKDRTKEWFEYSAGYNPMFTWWVKKPWEDFESAVNSYMEFIQKNLMGDTSSTAIPGDPIGDAALRKELEHEMISYSPEELFEIAKKEVVWCDRELKKYAKELGYADWREALEYVKTKHVEPGKQPEMVRELAEEAIEYLEKNDLITIPDLAKDVWRMTMMSPERQLVSPFFLGGESIIVSFPTDAMTHEQKLMSMRANNIHFSRAVTHHELIPGHHLQFFMSERFNTHRSGITNTPFWTEGWALYWEFLLYKRGFPATPEDRIGMLFWRKHRAARIQFSLGFHLGKMTTQECVDLLVNEVGHERSTAEGEVRRSFGGTYPPLYQAAYMLGAFQMWEIRRELVDTGKMKEKDFHDAVIRMGNMPWVMVRAILSGGKIEKDFDWKWEFYQGHAE